VVPLTTTLAVNCCVAPTCSVAVSGVIDTETTGGGVLVTVIVAVAFFVISATLVAVTVYVPAVLGAVNNPVAPMVPPDAAQLTPVLLVPVTLVANCTVAPVCTLARVGDIEIETLVGATTVTVAEADLLASAALVALTVKVPGELGAVNSPDELMLPPLAVQVTAVFIVPLTEAVNCCVVPDCSVTDAGLMATPTMLLTVTTAVAERVGSATLVAVTL